MLSKKSVDVVIPFYNEEECIPELFNRLQILYSQIESSYNTRFIFVNDGSSDQSLVHLLRLTQTYPQYVIIDLSRNFGHQKALTAGLDYAKADFVACIDADLQDPPELIADMLKVCESGYDVVYGQRKKREGETWFKLITAKWFYALFNRLCEVDIPRDTGDFRVISKKVLKCLQSMRERHRFIRGLVPWCGFKSTALPYHRDPRYSGETKYPFRKMVRFALDAIFSFSWTPLKIMRYLGLGVTVVGLLGGIWVLYLKLFSQTILPGITVILLSVIILGGVQILSLGVLGEYIGRIFEESKGRPLYIIDKVIDPTSTSTQGSM